MTNSIKRIDLFEFGKSNLNELYDEKNSRAYLASVVADNWYVVSSNGGSHEHVFYSDKKNLTPSRIRRSLDVYHYHIIKASLDYVYSECIIGGRNINILNIGNRTVESTIKSKFKAVFMKELDMALALVRL